jgi:hypothetical protein
MVEMQITDAVMRKEDPSFDELPNTKNDVATEDVASIYDPIRRIPENVLLAPPTHFRRKQRHLLFSNS